MIIWTFPFSFPLFLLTLSLSLEISLSLSLSLSHFLSRSLSLSLALCFMSSVCVLLLRNQKLEHELRWSGDQAPPPVMNPTTEPPPPPLPQFQPPQPPQPHRRTCDRHPEEHFTGFCPSCLCERLAVLEPSSSSSSAAPAASASASSSSRKPPSSAAASALKALFKPSSSKPPPPASASAFLPELRRTKSFSASKNEGFFSGIFEPQRKSCDVRVRSTLCTLFSLDDDRNPSKRDSTRSSNSEGVQAKNLGPAGVRGPVLESKEEEDAGAGSDYQQSKEYIVQEDEEEEEDDEIRAWEIVEEEEEEAEIEETAEPELEVVPEEEVKTMKDHIDLDSQAKKSSGRDLVGVVVYKAMKNTGNLIISSSSLPSEPTIVESTEESHNEKGVKEKISECSKALLNLESATDTVTHLISDLISMASEEELLKGSGSGLYNQAAELLPTIAHKVDALARLLRLGSNHSIVRN